MMNNIGQLFDSISKQYDRFNHWTSLGIDRYWRHQTVKQLRPCQHLLDVAIGTADLSIEILRHNKAQYIDGIDLSKEMMRVGQQKTDQLGLHERVHFTLGSALEMPYKDAQFDALTCAYGVRNFSNLDQGLREFYRVLKPGGQLLILEFSYPTNRLVAWCYDFYFRHIMTTIGAWLTHDRSAFDYFYRSVKGFICGTKMCDRLSAAGFANVRYSTYTCGISTLYVATKE